MIEALQPGETCSDLPALFRQSLKVFSSSPEHTRELDLFTDSQESEWQFDPKTVFNASWNKADIRTSVIRPDDLSPPNTAVISVKITSAMIMPGAPINGVAVVENFSEAPVEDVLEIQIGGERIARKSVSLSPWASAEVPFEGKLPQFQEPWIGGTAKIEPDNLTPDDTFYFSLPVGKHPRVLIVEGEQPSDERLHSGYFLKKALMAGETGDPPPDTIPVTSLDELSLIHISEPTRPY